MTYQTIGIHPREQIGEFKIVISEVAINIEFENIQLNLFFPNALSNIDNNLEGLLFFKEQFKKILDEIEKSISELS